MKTSWRPSGYSLLESMLALVAGFFALLALVRADWLESFGVNLDYGDGALEWAVPLAMALIAVVLGGRAVRGWRIDFARAIRARS
ncbi:MAG: hypothetical protein WCC14_00480 [Acidobacteriaceae bacterium]